jgi:hypothetical protein
LRVISHSIRFFEKQASKHTQTMQCCAGSCRPRPVNAKFLEHPMKKLSILAVAAAFAAATAAPVSAESKAQADPFVSTQMAGGVTLAVIGGVTLLVVLAASSSDGT